MRQLVMLEALVALLQNRVREAATTQELQELRTQLAEVEAQLRTERQERAQLVGLLAQTLASLAREVHTLATRLDRPEGVEGGSR